MYAGEAVLPGIRGDAESRQGMCTLFDPAIRAVDKVATAVRRAEVFNYRKREKADAALSEGRRTGGRKDRVPNTPVATRSAELEAILRSKEAL